jgi:hypothetical protein
MDVRMEHTEGRGRAADVWVDGALLRVCDEFSPPGQRTRPGLIEDVAFRYTSEESLGWEWAMRGNPSKKLTLEPVKNWSYLGYGRVVSVMPVVIDFDLLRMEDPNWSSDESLVGRFVRVPIDRLELVPATPEP